MLLRLCPNLLASQIYITAQSCEAECKKLSDVQIVTQSSTLRQSMLPWLRVLKNVFCTVIAFLFLASWVEQTNFSLSGAKC